MLVSIIVPIFNVKMYLKKCVESLLLQTYSSIEVLLVDDGSTDGSEIICEELAKLDSRVRVFHKNNGGLSSSRNFGLKHVKGDYVCFIDSDDWVEIDFVEKLVLALLEYDSDIACCGRKIFDGHKFKKSLCPKNKENVGDETAFKRMLEFDGTNFSFCDKMFRKSLFDSVEFPVNRYFEDTGTMYKLFEKVSSVVFIPQALYIYFQRENSITHSSYKRLDDLVSFSLEIVEFTLSKYPAILDSSKCFLGDSCIEQLELMVVNNVKTNKIDFLKKIIKENYSYLSQKNKLKYHLICTHLFPLLYIKKRR